LNDWVDAEQHVERAHEAYEQGRWDVAESELRHALSLNPYQAEWHFNLGLTLDAAGRHAEAARAFVDAHELRPEDGQTALLAGVNLVRSDRAKEALPWLELAAEREPDSTAPYVHRIDAYSDLGDHEQAELMFYLGQQINPEDGELYAAMGENLLRREEYERAVWCLREAIRLAPDLPRIQARLAEAYAKTGRQERARQLYMRELRQDPGDIDTLLDLGELLVDMSRFEEAGEKFRRVLELEPDNQDAHAALGDLAIRRGQIDEAIVQYDVVLRLDKGFPEARRRLADLLLQRGPDDDLDRARELLREELAEEHAEPEKFRPEDLDDLGQLLLDADMAHEAARVFRRLVDTREQAGTPDHLAHHHLSVALFETGDFEAGMAEAREALRLQPRFVPAMHNIAYAHLKQHQWMRARYWVRQAIRLAPDDASLRRLRFKLRLHSGIGLAAWIARRTGAVLRPVASVVVRRRRRRTKRAARQPAATS